jgi:hypothetical protein
MLSRKRTRLGPTPLMGRQLFRGQYAPLILANSSGISPDVYAGVYAIADPVVSETETSSPAATPGAPPNNPVQEEGCPFSAEEADVCGNWNSELPFCKKQRLTKSDSECSKLPKMECPLTNFVKEVCRPSHPENPTYAKFCDLQRHDNYCADEYRDYLKRQEIDKEAAKMADKWCIRINYPNPQTYCPVPSYMRAYIENDMKKYSYNEWYLE